MRLWIVALVFAVASPVLAQPAAQPQAQVNERREKIKKRIRALRAYTLTEELPLDEATAGKLFPVLSKYDDEFDKLLLARGDIQKRLRGSDSIKDPKELDRLIDEAAANQRSMWDTEDKRLAQLRKILTPAQVAKVLIVLPAMERKIQNQLRKAAAAKKHPAQAAGDDEDDDDDGDWGANPFAGKPPAAPRPNAAPVDPFAAPAKAKPRKQQQQPCDPFDTMTGCKSK